MTPAQLLRIVQPLQELTHATIIASSWSTVVADLTLTDAACRGSVKCGSTSRLQERAQWVVAAVIWPTLAYNR